MGEGWLIGEAREVEELRAVGEKEGEEGRRMGESRGGKWPSRRLPNPECQEGRVSNSQSFYL